MKLLDRIERHLKESHMSATRFGRRAVGDPRFVLDLRAGRKLGLLPHRFAGARYLYGLLGAAWKLPNGLAMG